jgi:hypothetical protein
MSMINGTDPWEIGAESFKQPLWIFYILINLPAGFINLLLIYILNFSKYKKLNAVSVSIAGLSSGNALLSLSFSVQCLINLFSFSTTYQSGHYACNIQAVFIVSSILIQCFCLTLSASCSYLDIVHGYKISVLVARLWIFINLCASIFGTWIVGIFSTIKLMPSGDYCLYDFTSPVITKFFIPLMFASLVIIVYCYLSIYREVKKSENVVQQANNTQKESVKVAKKTTLFVLMFFSGWFFVIFGCIYANIMGDITQTITRLILIFGTLHSFSSPFLYMFYSREVHKWFVHKLVCCQRFFPNLIKVQRGDNSKVTIISHQNDYVSSPRGAMSGRGRYDRSPRRESIGNQNLKLEEEVLSPRENELMETPVFTITKKFLMVPSLSPRNDPPPLNIGGLSPTVTAITDNPSPISEKSSMDIPSPQNSARNLEQSESHYVPGDGTSLTPSNIVTPKNSHILARQFSKSVARFTPSTSELAEILRTVPEGHFAPEGKIIDGTMTTDTIVDMGAPKSVDNSQDSPIRQSSRSRSIPSSALLRQIIQTQLGGDRAILTDIDPHYSPKAPSNTRINNIARYGSRLTPPNFHIPRNLLLHPLSSVSGSPRGSLHHNTPVTVLSSGSPSPRRTSPRSPQMPALRQIPLPRPPSPSLPHLPPLEPLIEDKQEEVKSPSVNDRSLRTSTSTTNDSTDHK